MALSLFGGKKHLHHFVAEQDVAKELFALLVEANIIRKSKCSRVSK